MTQLERIAEVASIIGLVKIGRQLDAAGKLDEALAIVDEVEPRLEALKSDETDPDFFDRLTRILASLVHIRSNIVKRMSLQSGLN